MDDRIRVLKDLARLSDSDVRAYVPGEKGPVLNYLKVFRDKISLGERTFLLSQVREVVRSAPIGIVYVAGEVASS